MKFMDLVNQTLTNKNENEANTFAQQKLIASNYSGC
jgi:hypothetical protein